MGRASDVMRDQRRSQQRTGPAFRTRTIVPSTSRVANPCDDRIVRPTTSIARERRAASMRVAIVVGRLATVREDAPAPSSSTNQPGRGGNGCPGIRS